MTSGGSSLLVALVQMGVKQNKAANLQQAGRLVTAAADNGARLVALPECFNCPYGNKFFPEYAESIPGESTQFLSEIARKNNVWLVGGSMPERDGDKIYNTATVFNPSGDCVAKHRKVRDKIYNTATVFNPSGDCVAKHRKVHLFDINVPGGIVFKESDTLSPGGALTTFEVAGIKIGLGICYDIRFPEMASLYNKMGCQLLLYPGAFNMTTGPAHWELLQKGRAVDNQCYVMTVSPARDTAADYIAYGHSMAVDPWGCVVAEAAEHEEIVYAEVDTNEIASIRANIPLSKQRRTDLFDIQYKK